MLKRRNYSSFIVECIWQTDVFELSLELLAALHAQLLFGQTS